MDDIWTELGWLIPRGTAAFPEVEPKQIRIWARDDSLVVLEDLTGGRHLAPRGSLVKREGYVEPLETLKSIIILPRDCGSTGIKVAGWLFPVEETLGETPLQTLLTGKRKVVRRIAGALAL